MATSPVHPATQPAVHSADNLVARPLQFQEVIMALHRFWAAQGCVLWQPYNIQVGAGTSNPATLLRVLGPEPWRVAYIEPSVRPDDGRYAENPNRMQTFFQYQVILKPDPGNAVDLYLQSLQAIGIDLKRHDVRFVEDNWENPTIGAWGLGWEVWLDGQEITQFTYFQQAGGLVLDVVSVEITYGLERIILALQDKDAAWSIDWTDDLTYADVFKRSEWEYSKYYFEIADVDGLRKVYDTYEAESKHALSEGLVLPAYDYILKCSHLFNELDTRGAIGVTERASYFRRMRDMTRAVAKTYVEQREAMGFPMLKNGASWAVAAPIADPAIISVSKPPAEAADLLLEIGVEELPAGDLDDAIAQLTADMPALLNAQRIGYREVQVLGTPRRLVVIVSGVEPAQPDRVEVVRGPSASVAFDKDGKPTKAAEGFARKNGVPVEALTPQTIDGGQYVVANVSISGQPTADVLSQRLPDLIGGIKFGKSMRWNSSGVAFSRPIRWIVALLGQAVIPFRYADIPSGNRTRGSRTDDAPILTIRDAQDYLSQMGEQKISLSHTDRKAQIVAQSVALAQSVGGTPLTDEGLLEEIANLVEQPTALRGSFDPRFLDLPLEVLVMVMRKHQRYMAVVDEAGKLLPYFIAVRSGGTDGLDAVTKGNEQVLIARFSDAAFFVRDDEQHTLFDFLPRLKTLIVHEKLGSMFDKNERIKALVAPLADRMKLSEAERAVATQAAAIVKADLATHMVVEMTALAGIMGREYALREGQPEPVAKAIFEATLPRGAGDQLPTAPAGTLLAVADRLDSLTGFFAAGVSPTATADPYGLRRAALGVVQLLIDGQVDLDLSAAIDVVAAQLPIPVSASVKADLLDFIGGRLRGWLLDERHFAFDVAEAVLAAQANNPYRALIGCQALSAWVARPDWAALLDAYARCVRIVRSDAAKDATAAALHPEALTPAESQALYTAYRSARATLDKAADPRNIAEFLTAFVPLVPPITAFFDHVLVMDNDPAVRANRLALLRSIASLTDGRVDLSRLMGF